MNESTVSRLKKVVFTSLFIGILVVGYNVFLFISRIGETKVVIEAAPKSSLIFINGEPGHAGANYLSEGEYTIQARMSGFTDAEEKIQVLDKPQVVYLLPEANTEKARQYLTDNPGDQTDRVVLWDKLAYKKGQTTRSKTPIIESLPYTSVGEYFSIDFGPSDNPKIGTELIVSNSSPEGRANALKWIRQQGYDPTDYYIKFVDFNNPLGGQ